MFALKKISPEILSNFVPFTETSCAKCYVTVYMYYIAFVLYRYSNKRGMFSNMYINTDCRSRLPDVKCDVVPDVRHDNGTCYNDGNFTGVWNYTMFKEVTNRTRIAPTREYWE